MYVISIKATYSRASTKINGWLFAAIDDKNSYSTGESYWTDTKTYKVFDTVVSAKRFMQQE